MKLRGAREYRARLRAVSDVGRPIGQRWATDAAALAASTAPRRTGRLAGSFRPGLVTSSRATLTAVWYSIFPDQGTRPHVITPRGPALVFDGSRGNTIFAKRVRHPGMRGTKFIGRAARGAFTRTPMAATLAGVWNRAA